MHIKFVEIAPVEKRTMGIDYDKKGRFGTWIINEDQHIYANGMIKDLTENSFIAKCEEIAKFFRCEHMITEG